MAGFDPSESIRERLHRDRDGAGPKRLHRRDGDGVIYFLFGHCFVPEQHLSSQAERLHTSLPVLIAPAARSCAAMGAGFPDVKWVNSFLLLNSIIDTYFLAEPAPVFGFFKKNFFFSVKIPTDCGSYIRVTTSNSAFTT